MRNVDKILRCLFVVSVCALLAADSLADKGNFLREEFVNSQKDIIPVNGQIHLEKRQQQSGRIIREHILGSAEKEAIQKILTNSQKEMTASYEIDELFLRWMSNTYGRKSLYDLGQAAEKRTQNIESWHEITGKSLHVLWVEYCRSAKDVEYDLNKIYDKECAVNDQVILDFTGDINLSEGWSSTNYLDKQPGGIKDCFSDALWQEMQAADILMINNEFTFSEQGKPLPRKPYTFRANPDRVHVLTEMGIDIVSLANNHVYDYGEEALLDTLVTLETAQIPYVGAGRNLKQAEEPAYFIANGRKIAIVAATQIERSLNYTKEAAEKTAGVLKTLNPDKFVSVIKQAKSQSDYVIAFVH